MKTLLKICILFIALQTMSACTIFAGSGNTPAAPGTCPSPGNQACNELGGIRSNAVVSGVNGATISGGGQPGLPNRVTGNFGTVSGGYANTAGEGSTVSGGSYNAALYFYSSVGGGTENLASGPEATIGGGLHNLASGRRATVSGGAINSATDIDAAVGGGSGNISSDRYATIGGGAQNNSSNVASTVAGGSSNTASGAYSTVAGGVNNTSSEFGAAAGGGTGNLASGAYATVPGGFANQAAAEFSFAAGRRARVASGHPGTFLFADSNDAVFTSQAANEFGIRATGGVRIVTGIDAAGNPASEARLAPGSGAWEVLSDQNAKMGILPVDGRHILESLMKVPISTWNYRDQAPTVRHMGPVAQDFYSAFGLGEDHRYISTIDADGVALASIQGLHQVMQAQEEQIKALKAENAAQREQLAGLETRVSALERTGNPNTIPAGAPVNWSAFILIGLVVLVIRRQDFKEGINKWLS